MWLLAANASCHVLDWNVATWEDRSHGTRPQPLVPASINERCECERRQPTRSGSQSWFATEPWFKKPPAGPCRSMASASSMLSCTLAYSAAPACRPTTPALCRLVGGWRSWRGLAGQGVPAQEAGGASDPDSPGPRRGIDPAAGFSDFRGSCLPRVAMTRGSFEAWMKRLVCLWGVWCRLKEFPEPWTRPFQAEREKMRHLAAGMKARTLTRYDGNPRLWSTGTRDNGEWCGGVPTVGGRAAGSLSLWPPHPSSTASYAPCSVAPSTAATEQEGWFPGRPWVVLRTCV